MNWVRASRMVAVPIYSLCAVVQFTRGETLIGVVFLLLAVVSGFMCRLAKSRSESK